MDKVLVEVFVPAVSQTYDIFIPLSSTLFEVTELIKKAVFELSDNMFIPSSTTAICRHGDGAILNINMSVYELGIHNGSKLMLI